MWKLSSSWPPGLMASTVGMGGVAGVPGMAGVSGVASVAGMATVAGMADAAGVAGMVIVAYMAVVADVAVMAATVLLPMLANREPVSAFPSLVQHGSGVWVISRADTKILLGAVMGVLSSDKAGET